MSSPPTLEDIQNDPKRYYPFLVEILQCFGCNYFDKQGTEKGRGGEITIFQKVNGVTQRIANVIIPTSVDCRMKSCGRKTSATKTTPSSARLGAATSASTGTKSATTFRTSPSSTHSSRRLQAHPSRSRPPTRRCTRTTRWW